LVAVTRLHLRSRRFILPFAWSAWRSYRQAVRAPCGLGANVRKTAGLAFWTLTAWSNTDAMMAYLNAPPHREAMPKLREWCDEASVAHWLQESEELPDWATAERRMAECGRLSRVNHPSADQRAGRLNFAQEAT
jgi:hypothetical protein